MKSLILRSSRAFLGGGGFLGLWAIPGDICKTPYFSTHIPSFVIVTCANNNIFHCKKKKNQVCYRCSWGHPSGWEAWSHHWHHGSSSNWCSGLMEWKRVNKTRCLLFYGCVRATQREWLSISYPVMSCLGITRLDWRSYHGEARVNPHKRTDTHGYGLKVWTRGDGEEEVGCYYTTFQMKIWQNEHRKQKFKVKKKDRHTECWTKQTGTQETRTRHNRKPNFIFSFCCLFAYEQGFREQWSLFHVAFRWKRQTNCNVQVCLNSIRFQRKLKN